MSEDYINEYRLKEIERNITTLNQKVETLTGAVNEFKILFNRDIVFDYFRKCIQEVAIYISASVLIGLSLFVYWLTKL